MEIIDNALSKLVFQKLQREVMGWAFPWFWGRVVTEDPNMHQSLYGWSHTLFDEGRPVGRLWEPLELAILNALDATGHQVKTIHRVRLVLNTASDQPRLNGEHVDFDFLHNTALLYLNDSDGDTVIYNEQFDSAFNNNAIDYRKKFLPETLTALTTIEPKENRLVWFNGLHYHTGTLPVTTARRVVMNINYST